MSGNPHVQIISSLGVTLYLVRKSFGGTVNDHVRANGVQQTGDRVFVEQVQLCQPGTGPENRINAKHIKTVQAGGRRVRFYLPSERNPANGPIRFVQKLFVNSSAQQARSTGQEKFHVCLSEFKSRRKLRDDFFMKLTVILLYSVVLLSTLPVSNVVFERRPVLLWWEKILISDMNPMK